MVEHKIISPKHGTFTILADDQLGELVEAYTWGLQVGRRKDGSIRAYVKTNVRRPDGRWTVLQLQRIIVAASVGRDLLPGEHVDHINGDTLDNRLSNLRLCSQAENNRNARRRHDNTSGLKGVYFNKRLQKFAAKISIDGHNHHLGLYPTAADAHQAYAEASRRFHGEFGRTA